MALGPINESSFHLRKKTKNPQPFDCKSVSVHWRLFKDTLKITASIKLPFGQMYQQTLSVYKDKSSISLHRSYPQEWSYVKCHRTDKNISTFYKWNKIVILFQSEFSIFHTGNMDTDFPEGYIEVASISYKKIWSQVFPQKIWKLHASLRKTWVEFSIFPSGKSGHIWKYGKYIFRMNFFWIIL